MNNTSEVARVELTGDGFKVSGAIVFASVPELLRQTKSLFPGKNKLHIDLSQNSHADSAAIALIVEWCKLARANNRDVQWIGLPAQLRSLAAVSGVEDLITESAVALSLKN